MHAVTAHSQNIPVTCYEFDKHMHELKHTLEGRGNVLANWECRNVHISNLPQKRRSYTFPGP